MFQQVTLLLFLMTVVNLLLPLPQLFWTSARGGWDHFYGSLCTNTWCLTFGSLYLTPGPFVSAWMRPLRPSSYQTVWLLTLQTGKHTFSSTTWVAPVPEGPDWMVLSALQSANCGESKKHRLADAHDTSQYTLLTRFVRREAAARPKCHIIIAT